MRPKIISSQSDMNLSESINRLRKELKISMKNRRIFKMSEWGQVPGGYEIGGYLGSRGFYPSKLKTAEDLLDFAKKVFPPLVSATTCLEAAHILKLMKPSKRRQMAEAAKSHFDKNCRHLESDDGLRQKETFRQSKNFE